MKQFPILYSRASTGAVQQWQIFVQGDSFWTVAGQVGGALTAAKPTIAKGKNLGKANETTPEQQAEIEAEAKFVKKKRENYFENIADIDSGFLEPQLAKPCKDYLAAFDWSNGGVLDDKLNGWACTIETRGAFTRANKQYHNVAHVLDVLETFLFENPRAYLQGELFNPAYVNDLGKIAELVSVGREKKDITPELAAESKKYVQFHWYDGYNFKHPLTGADIQQDTPLIERRRAIDAWIKILDSESIKSVRYDIVHSEKEAWQKASEYIKKGGEGKVLKNPKARYQHKRTKDLLKLKKSEDKEFQIVGDMDNPFVEGKGNCAGCAEAVWVHNPSGVEEKYKRFKINIEGSKEFLREVFLNLEKYKNQWITGRFQEYSPYGVPLIPYTDLVLREQIEGKGTVNQPKETKQAVFDL